MKTCAPLLLFVLMALACKVPISDVGARFTLADVSWFAEEETLFVFYEMSAEQGLGANSVLEIRYTTDDGVVPWTALSKVPQVHTHVPVQCGRNSACGSGSLRVAREPRDVALRLRYHEDGELALDAYTQLNVVGPGPLHSHRSLLVYGVFDRKNQAIQWRARHRFPTIRNAEAERLGLRRVFHIEGQRAVPDDRFAVVDAQTGANPFDPGGFGGPLPGGAGEPDAGKKAVDNPYFYGVECPPELTSLGLKPVETQERAVFQPDDLPSSASGAPAVCATSRVHTATGPLFATAVARKNSEVRPAFPLLRSPVKDATPIKYLLSVCDRTLSKSHLTMQRQRLLLDDIEALCVDDWQQRPFADELVARFRRDIERVRASGSDMVLSIALHHDTPGLRPVVEEALQRTMEGERTRATPRVAGAFVLDSYSYAIEQADVSATTLWCPSDLDLDGLDGGIPDPSKDLSSGAAASLACGVITDIGSLELGPFMIGGLPIFPSRAQYLDFIDRFSEDQAGEMLSLSFRVPELPPSADHVSVQPIGVATFFNDEVITADPVDAFSFCQTDGDFSGFVFRSDLSPTLLPISFLPGWHESAQETSYDLGIVWDFPYLLRLRYKAVGALSVNAFSASLPFGISGTARDDFGSEAWLSEEFSLAETLAQCRRFCDHPTFDSAGVYQVRAAFRTTYAATCYRPAYPARGDSGFPDDP